MHTTSDTPEGERLLAGALAIGLVPLVVILAVSGSPVTALIGLLAAIALGRHAADR